VHESFAKEGVHTILEDASADCPPHRTTRICLVAKSRLGL